MCFRATAFGVLNALCKLAAVLGSSIFASFVGITKIIPILLSFTALMCGGLVALKLPDTREKILMWGSLRIKEECEKGRERPKHAGLMLDTVYFRWCWFDSALKKKAKWGLLTIIYAKIKFPHKFETFQSNVFFRFHSAWQVEEGIHKQGGYWENMFISSNESEIITWWK